MLMTRRELLGASAAVTAAAAAEFWIDDAHAAETPSRYRKVFPKLDRFVKEYMRDMNSPGMTLVLADRAGVQRVATYGFSDLARRTRVRPDELFQIGSITKSFMAIVLLQLRDEGKLDLDKPVTNYLPWLRIESAYAPITTRHLLTHTSGLPGFASAFPSDPGEKHLAAYAPGKQFHYNNTAYEVLGYLAWTLDGRELPELFRERIFRPLGMLQSEPAISFDARERFPTSYSALLGDRPYVRFGRLAEAPFVADSTAPGCIAATARDMGAYIQMIANRGLGPRGPLISPESFELFSKHHIKAEIFGPAAGYGYGIAVDELDGNVLLWHTGGMVSFISAMSVDITAGVGAFASINAYQDYRPSPVLEYAIRLMRAANEGGRASAPPPPGPADKVENAADYAGVFTGDHGSLEFAAEGDRLYLLRPGKRIALEPFWEADQFLVNDRAFDRFPLVFGRKKPAGGSENPESSGPVVDVSWGDAWYAGSAYDGPRQFDVPAGWRSYVGHYRNESPWIGSHRIVLRKGALSLNGVIPLEQDGELFRLRDEPSNTEWVRFGEVVNGKCMHIKLSGQNLWRVATP